MATIAETIEAAGLPEWSPPIVAACTVDPTFLERRVTVENLAGVASAAEVDTLQQGLLRFSGLAQRHKLGSYLPAVLAALMTEAPNAVQPATRVAVAQALVSDAQAELAVVATEFAQIIGGEYVVAFPPAPEPEPEV